jgi:hypothetical protein
VFATALIANTEHLRTFPSSGLWPPSPAKREKRINIHFAESSYRFRGNNRLRQAAAFSPASGRGDCARHGANACNAHAILDTVSRNHSICSRPGMPKSLHTIDDHVQSIVETRRRTAAGRFNAVGDDVERVADVIAGAGAVIAEVLSEHGFRWSAGKSAFTRKVGIFKHVIRFQGDADNRSGLHVGVSLHAEVTSTALAQWRRSHCGRANGAILWATQVGYLSDAHSYLKWQLVDAALRASEIDSMVSAIRDWVLPVFEVYSAPETLVQHLDTRRELMHAPHWAIEIALWLQSPQTAEDIVAAVLIARPGEADAFWQHHRRFQARLPVETPFAYAAALAWTCVKHGVSVPDVQAR